MRKIYRILSADVEASNPSIVPGSATLSDDYLTGILPSFNPARIHDWSASRVIISRYKGRDIDKMSANEQAETYELARKVVDFVVGVARFQRAIGPFTYRFKQKDNGYNAGHWDIHGVQTFAPGPLNFEIQLKTQEWHEVAEHGKAAHYYYIGGDPTFMMALNTAYHDILSNVVGRNGSTKVRP